MRHAILTAALLLSTANGAYALTEVNPPAGWSGVRAYVAREQGTNKIWAGFQSGLSGIGSCGGWVQIGTSTGGLWDEYFVNGTSARDEFWIPNTTTSTSICGKNLVVPNFSGDPINIYTWSGDDVVVARGIHPELTVDMGYGYDLALFGSANNAFGGSDNDTIIATNSAVLRAYGESGNDLFCNYGQNWLEMDGGDGNDQRFGNAWSTTNLESVAPSSSACDSSKSAAIAYVGD